MAIDKAQDSEMFFDTRGHLQCATPAPPGLERSEDSAPGIGQRMKY